MAYIGSCPDMCPESERRTRVGHLVSIFERDHNNQPNEYAMVKMYRRSGADQEEPAPDDLRTLEALKRTLDHLVCNIMDDERSTTQELALEWYDFLWDRLRAIRKDITQQNICDPSSAILVERCTRFLVHSCYAMNRVKNFDANVNRRNLNDCLQMLRQMYHDLRTTTGTVCAGEFEFQKYDILLHLNVDHLSSTVLMQNSDYRSSDGMRFITRVFNAYTNNDYHKFFKLLRQADYMTSCVLSLYANEMRLIGLRTIITACASQKTTLYPADLAVDSLGFDDYEDLVQFVTAIGILTQSKADKLHIVLSKDVFSILNSCESNVPSLKSSSLVEDKMQGCSVGQLVYGPAEQMEIEEMYEETQRLSQSFLSSSEHSMPEEVKEDEEHVNRVAEEIEMVSYDVIANHDANADQPSEPTTESVCSNEITIDNAQVDQQGTKEYQVQDVAGTKNYHAASDVLAEPKVVAKLPDEVRLTPNKEIPPTVEAPCSLSPVKNLFNSNLPEEASRVPIETAKTPSVSSIVSSTSEAVENSVDANGAETNNEGDADIWEDTLWARVLKKRQAANLDRRQIADVMPAGHFIVGSLSTAQPTLRLPAKIPGEAEVKKMRRCTTVNRPQKELDSISLSIKDEKEANEILAQLHEMFTE